MWVVKTGNMQRIHWATFMRLIIGLIAVPLVLAVSCDGAGGESSSDPVSVVRILQGQRIEGKCVFDDDISQYPATYQTNPENCLQVVSIGPIGVDQLERMKRDVPLFWEKSYPYQQVLIGEWVDGECNFDSPGVRALMAVSETVSTDWTACQRLVNVGPVTERQAEEINRTGGESETSEPEPT